MCEFLLLQFDKHAEPNSRIARVSAGHCLKLCDYTPSVATPLKQNNTQELDPDRLAASFPVQWMFASVLADRGRPQPFCLSISPVSSIRLIKSHKVLLFHFRDGNSWIIVNALHSFSNLNVFIKILWSFVKDAMFININYVTTTDDHSIKNYWPAFNQRCSVLFFSY